MTQKEYIGFGSILCLREILVELGSRSIFLVTGKGSYSACGAESCLENLLKNYEVHRFCEFAVNPKLEDIDRGINVFKAVECDMVIAVGGGSTIDMAKAINFLSAHPQTLGTCEIRTSVSETAVRPLIAIPTTSGSGSEATHFAVVYADRQKQSIADERMLPVAAIVDTNLTMSLPRYATAVSGLDALSQAIESFWSIHSSEESKGFARRALELILPNIGVAVREPTPATRSAMAEGAHLAGKAINITKTTAAHAISYPITSYFGVAHGHAVGLILPSLLEYNAQVAENDVLDLRGGPYVRKIISEIVALFGANDVLEAKEKLEHLMSGIGLETRLSGLGIKSEKDFELIIHNSFKPERVGNNPRLLTEEALRKMLHRMR